MPPKLKPRLKPKLKPRPKPKLKLQIDRLLEERSVEPGGPVIDTQSNIVANGRAEAVGLSVELGRKFRCPRLTIQGE